MIELPCTSETVRDRMNSFRGHSFFGFVGARPLFAEHTAAEHAALQKWASGRRRLAEIGVAEGVSAFAIREAMDECGMLFLIDPFHLSRVPALNFMRRAAHRAVRSCKRGRVLWIEEFSYNAVRQWTEPLDFLMIDGDHSEEGVRKDWEDWSRFVKPGGVVAFHDARTFEGGWTNSNYSPVKLVNELFRTSLSTDWKIVDEVDSLVVLERCSSDTSEARHAYSEKTVRTSMVAAATESHPASPRRERIRRVLRSIWPVAIELWILAVLVAFFVIRVLNSDLGRRALAKLADGHLP